MCFQAKHLGQCALSYAKPSGGIDEGQWWATSVQQGVEAAVCQPDLSSGKFSACLGSSVRILRRDCQSWSDL